MRPVTLSLCVLYMRPYEVITTALRTCSTASAECPKFGRLSIARIHDCTTDAGQRTRTDDDGRSSSSQWRSIQSSMHMVFPVPYS